MRCHEYHAAGMIFQAYAKMLRNIDTSIDVSADESAAYESIKQEYSELSAKISQVNNKSIWNLLTTQQKQKGVDDLVKIHTHHTKPNFYLVEAVLDVPCFASFLLACRPDFFNTWIKAVPEASIVKIISKSSFIAKIKIANPLIAALPYFEKYIRIDYAEDNNETEAVKSRIFLRYSILDRDECTRQYLAPLSTSRLNPDFFMFKSVLFIMSGNQHQSKTNCQIYIEDMQFLRYAPARFNGFLLSDFLYKMCIIWANEARRLDILHEKFSSLTDIFTELVMNGTFPPYQFTGLPQQDNT